MKKILNMEALGKLKNMIDLIKSGCQVVHWGTDQDDEYHKLTVIIREENASTTSPKSKE